MKLNHVTGSLSYHTSSSRWIIKTDSFCPFICINHTEKPEWVVSTPMFLMPSERLLWYCLISDFHSEVDHLCLDEWEGKTYLFAFPKQVIEIYCFILIQQYIEMYFKNNGKLIWLSKILRKGIKPPNITRHTHSYLWYKTWKSFLYQQNQEI